MFLPMDTEGMGLEEIKYGGGGGATIYGLSHVR